MIINMCHVSKLLSGENCSSMDDQTSIYMIKILALNICQYILLLIVYI